ncbi:unnamed protein product [Scytosiphon promiscuus]
MDSSPPIISLRPLRNPELNECTTATVHQIEASFKTYGCVCIPLSDLDTPEEDGQELLSRCYRAAESFFTLPETVKMEFTEEEASQKGFGGSCYTPLGKEPAYKEGEKQHVESFSCTRPVGEALCGHLPRGPELHRSLFPDSKVPGFGAAYSSLWENLRERICLPMMRALEDMLQLPRGFLLRKSSEMESLNMSLLRTLRYPIQDTQRPSPGRLAEDRVKRRRSARNQVPVDVGISEHSDFEVFTIMHQESKGLHLRTPSRRRLARWYQLPFRQDTLTVILGDMAELWTAGWLEATRHKVVSPAPGQGVRKSLVLFQAHDDLVKVHPLETTHLAPHVPGPESSTGDTRNQSDSNSGVREHVEEGPAADSFQEWVKDGPRSRRKCYLPTTQGAWVRRQELHAKSTLGKLP